MAIKHIKTLTAGSKVMTAEGTSRPNPPAASEGTKEEPPAPEPTSGASEEPPAPEDPKEGEGEGDPEPEESGDSGYDLDKIRKLNAKSKGQPLRDYMREVGLIGETDNVSAARSKAEELLGD